MFPGWLLSPVWQYGSYAIKCKIQKKKTSVTAKGSLLALYAAEAPCLENIDFWIYLIHKFNKVRFPLFTQKLGAVPEAPAV